MKRAALISLLTLAFVASIATTAQAEPDWEPVSAAAAASTGSAGFQSGSAAAAMGWVKLGEDHFVAVNVATTLNLGLFRVGINAPLNLRVLDNDPQNEGVVRKEDWDEPSEWLRILRFVEVGSPRGTFFVRFGELVASSMGHGTIVDAYYNSIDPDHYQGGLKLRIDPGPGGGELLIDNIIEPELVGVRGFIRPLRIFMGSDGLLGRLATGVSLVSDLKAPARLIPDEEGTTGVDDDGVPTTDSERTVMVGLDAELPLVDTDARAHAPPGRRKGCQVPQKICGNQWKIQCKN